MANFRQTPNGNWQVQVRRHGFKFVVKTFKTKPDATQWARLIESEIDRGLFVDRTQI